MRGKLLSIISQYIKQNKKRRSWRGFVRVVAGIVVFCTTYALILPAITMEKLQCGLEEHTHTESCYQKVVTGPEQQLICTYDSLGVHVHDQQCYGQDYGTVCGFADYVVHSHNDGCLDANGNLVCQLPVVKEHIHTEDCFRYPEGTETSHIHNEDCYTTERGELICDKNESEAHTHSDACRIRGELICQLPEQEGHIHGAECKETILDCVLTVEPHQHTDTCYQQLVCELEEIAGHMHSSECSGKVLDCQVEDDTHEHDDSCYRQLVCELEEVEGHTHNEACSGKALNCELTEQPHNHTEGCYKTNIVCELPETEGHTHDDSCYEFVLTCELVEEEGHTHTDSCYEPVSKLICELEESVPAEAEPEEVPAEPELVCEKEVIQLHAHDEETCYETNPDTGEKQLICTELVVLGHSHNENCYVTVESDDDLLSCTLAENHAHNEECYDAEGALTCEVAEGHTHTDLCYGTWELICGKEEHTHTGECYAADPEETTESADPEETADPTATEETTALTDIETDIKAPLTQIEEAGEIKNNLSEIDTEEQNQNAGIALMALIPKDYLVEPTLIEGSNVTWEFYLNGAGEYVLRFDGEGPMPDYARDHPGRPWLDWHRNTGGVWLHLEFGENVTTAGAWICQGMNIASIDFGGVQEIRPYAFCYGHGPSVLDIPGTVKIIREDTTNWRSSINSVILHEGTEILEIYCLNNYSSLNTELYIPSTVTQITGTPTAGVSAYTVSENNPNYCSVDGVIYSKDMKTLIGYPKNRKVDEFRIPDGVETVGTYAFWSATIGKLIIPPSVKVLGDRFGQNMFISEVYFEDGCQIEKVGGLPFYMSSGLTNIRYPENTATPLISLFSYSNAETVTMYTHFTVPNKITTIKKMPAHFLSLETLTYQAENADIIDKQLFEETAAYNLIVDTQVNHLPTNFTCFVSPAGAVYFRGENTFTADSGAFAGGGEPLESLSGKFFVDTNGVLYQCLDNNTAKVVYVSGDVPAELTIPATIKTDGDITYQVTAVGENAFRSAESLTSLQFENPGQITDLAAYAMANCPSLQSVNGKTTKAEAEGTFPNAPVKTNLFYNTALDRLAGDQNGDGVLDGTGQESLTVQREGATDLDIQLRSAGGTMQWAEINSGTKTGYYQLLTGDTMTITASVGNTEGNEDFTYRVYFRITGEDGELDILPGQTYQFDGQTAICYSTEDPNVIYLEFRPSVGATVNIPVTAVYPTPNSPGGGVEIWGVIQSNEEAEAKINKVVSAKNVIQIQWTTKRDDFQLSKTGNTGVFGIVSNGAGGGKPNRDMAWAITMQRETETTSAYGKDYAKSAVFTDTITLPAGFSWNPDLVEALKDQNVVVKSTKDSFILNDFVFARLSLTTSSAPLKSLEAYWDTEKDTLAFRWELYNRNITEAEMYASSMTLTIIPEAVSIDMTQIDMNQSYLIHNDVSADVHYNYSAPVTLTASADNHVTGGQATLSLKKTSSGAKYFGEDVTYTIDMYNNGAVPYVDQDGKTFTLTDELSMYSYIKPEKMEDMFELYGTELVITIENAVLGPWQQVTGTDGKPAWIHPGNSDIGTTDHSLAITVTEGNQYQVTVDGTTIYTAVTAAEALKNAGYAVTNADKYICTWTLNHPDGENDADRVFMLDSGAHHLYYVYATVKDSFGIITKDWPNTYPTDTKVSVYNLARLKSKDSNNKDTQHNTAGVTDNVLREAGVKKSAYIGNEVQYDGSKVADGTVLTYYLDFYHYGRGTYQNLPMVDDLYGSQYLLVPMAANTHLAGENLPTHEDGGVSYYVLKEGSYSNVTVGVDDEGHSLIAATVTVGTATDDIQVDLGGNTYAYSGIHTQIKWYFPEKPGEEYWMQVHYKALVDLNQSGVTYTIGNAVWMNDRKDTRIYDFIWGGGTIIDFDKDIVTEKGATFTDDVTTKYSLIPRGGKVLYRLMLHNTNGYPFSLNGADIGDALPNTFNVFEWDKTNVELTEIQVDHATISYDKLDAWTIADSFSGLAGDSQKYIVWPEDAYINFQENSTICLYFTLTYPENGEVDLWNQYAAAVGDNRLFNTFYVYRFPSTVEHHLHEPGKVLLQKGVSGMYYHLYISPDFNYHPAGTSRVFYNNHDQRQRTVLYYVTLYNGSGKRLYLDNLYDKLPEGFTFFELIKNMTPTESASGGVSSIVTVGGVQPDISGLVGDIDGSVVFRKAAITPVPSDDGVMFRISGSSGNYALLYDSEREKYYLNSGEAIVFGYTCKTGTADTTKEIATNAIAMPYDDYLDTGLTVIPETQFPVSAGSSEYFLDTNDGTRLVMTNQEVVDRYGFPSSTEKEWLVSDVTVRRGGIRPGVTKYTDAYTAEGGNRQEYKYSVIPTATVHWRVSLHNAGTLSLVNYTFTDIMPKPYIFEDDIEFHYYDAHNVLVGKETIATLPKRTGEETSIAVNAGGKTYNVVIGQDPVDISGNKGKVFLSIGADESGNEVLKLVCAGTNMAIPEGGYVDVILSSRNPTNTHVNTVYTNRATLHPNAQPFDNVGHGSMLKDEQGNAVGAMNYSPANVSFGYATRSEKWVTEDIRPNNTGVSADPNRNKIILESADSIFTYKLIVGNETEYPMNKLVIIDNLPEPGDHTPFDTSVFRDSAFAVYFADDPAFEVKVVQKDGTETVLSTDQYSLEFSNSTDFGGPQSNDWKGEPSEKWTAVRGENSRAFRLIIVDPDATLIPHESQLEVTFKARADHNAEPGTVAWNNFGYHYGLHGISGELEAMPLVVGVAIPSVPTIEKNVVDAGEAPVNVKTATEFSFLVYKGEALQGDYETEEQLRAALASENRAVEKVTVTVDAGKSVSDTCSLDFDGWDWKHGDKYTVVELPGPDQYSFLRFEGSDHSYITFTYDETITQKIVCVNALEEWAIHLNKTDPAGKKLAGAVFALYGPNANAQLSEETADAWNAARTINIDGKDWYLTAVAETVESGDLSWTNLLEDSYYLLEIKAPDGYQQSTNGQIVYRHDSTDGVFSLTVINKPGYEIPETGGAGTTSYTLGGLLLMAAAILLYIHIIKRRKEERPSF